VDLVEQPQPAVGVEGLGEQEAQPAVVVVAAADEQGVGLGGEQGGRPDQLQL
jgi:hypothetical protein